jgi:acetyl-CoA carboxylase biotin carboxylase subunit
LPHTLTPTAALSRPLRRTRRIFWALAFRESYLNIERIIGVAQKCGVDALHPGYGFLAENAAFADACESAGITFIGPSGDTMRLLGDKVAARRLAAQAGVPLVPGDDNVVGLENALAAAGRVGYPVLVKAVAGGGGKGIRIVSSDREMEAALAVAGSEAVSAFGDHALYIEIAGAGPARRGAVYRRRKGQCLTLGERECSIQRRHQKLIEESPSPAGHCPEGEVVRRRLR